MKGPKLVITKDLTKDFQEMIASFRHDAVLVGIPESDTDRSKDPEGKAVMTNAALLAINEFGSAINNIPARPVMAIGIRNARDQIAELFKQATLKALSSGISEIGKVYERIGIVASNSVKKAINSQEGIKPPADATLKARKRAGFSGTKALLVTGQMRNAITYVVRGKK